MLGEIFGRRAGLTCTELVLLRFLLGRPVGLESRRLLATELVGEAIALRRGLGMTELQALGRVALVGAIFGVLRADSRGVVWSSLA